MVDKDRYLQIRIPSDELHSRLGLGIPKSSLMMIEGQDGSGKSILAQRMTTAFLRQGGSVTYISTELTNRDFLIQMDSINYPVAEFFLNGQLIFIPMFPRFGKTIPRKDFFARMMRAEPLFKSDAIIIDSLSPLISETFTQESYFELLLFFKKLIGMDKVIILAVNPDFIDTKLLRILESTCDIHFDLMMKSVGTSLKRFITVKRFNGGSKPVGELIGFRVEPGLGFVVEIASVM